MFYIILIIGWILSPLVLIPLLIKKTKTANELQHFVDDLCRCGRISNSEYANLKAEKTVSAPLSADNGGNSARASAPANTAAEEKAAVTGTAAISAAPGIQSEANKYLRDIPVYAQEKNVLSANENKTYPAAEPRRLPDAKPVEAAVEKTASTKEAAPKIKKEKAPAGKKRAAAMSVLMMIGIIFVVLAGLVFSTAVWVNLGEIGRTLSVGTVAAMFFGIGAFTWKKMKLERTSFAFYTLGAFFSAITLITAGFFGVMGAYFSVAGEGACLLYAAALLIIALFSAKGRCIFDIPAAAYISVFCGVFAAVLLLVQLSPDTGVFALLAALFAAAVNISVYVLGLKISDKWEKPLHIVVPVMNAVALLGGVSAAFGSSPMFYAAAAVFVIRSIAAAVMGFKGRRVYKTRPAAVSSLSSGAFFALLAMFKLSASAEVFALSAAVFGILFALGMFTFGLSVPEDWNVPVKTTAFVLNAVGVISAFYVLMRNFGDWNGVCFAAAGVYIVSSFAVGIMAVRGHERYGETPSAFASMFTGLAFSVMLVAELSASMASAALCLTVMLLVFVNAVYTARSRLPENWKTAADVTSALLGLISVFCTAFTFIDSFGNWDASCYTVSLLYILQAAVITAAAYRSHAEYSKCRWAVLSQLAGIFFAVLTLAQLAENSVDFMLYLTIFAVAYLNFVHTFKIKKPENWEISLKVFSCILGLLGAVFTIPQMLFYSEWTYQFYVSAGIYIAYAAAVTAMAFLKHGEYSKARWAAVSQFIAIVIPLIIIYKKIETAELFVLIFAAYGALYSAAVCLAFLKLPERWDKTVNSVDIIFNIAAAIPAAGIMLGNFGDWNIYCFLTALLYIGYTAVRGVRNNNSPLKAAECFLAGIAAFNLCCAAEEWRIAAPEFLLVCMLFALTLAHHFAKPLRTLFSDIYLPAALTVSAIACAAEHNIFGIIGFALLGAAMLIKSAEKESKLSEIFKILLPLPASGMVLTFAYYSFSSLFADMAALNAAVLAAAAAVIFKIKGGNKTFYSFAFTAAAMLFIGAASEVHGMMLLLLAVSVLLTVLFCKCGNNLPSLVTMAGTAAVMYRIAETASYQTEFNISLLLAAIFAAASLAASRIFYGGRFLDRENGRFKLDTCCSGILLALPMIRSENGRVTAFAVLVILAVFAANLVRREHSGDFNRAALTAASGLLTLAFIFRPFLLISGNISPKITLLIICGFGFAFSKIWAKYPSLSENFSSAVYGICFVSLVIDALVHQNLFNTLTVLGVSAAILLYSFISKKKRWFAVSSVSLLGLTVYMFRDFFTMIDWWIYLLAVGLILIAVSAANEYFVRKGKELKEKAGRFFEDWKW
ncbi:MAG: hypothetical protein NC395_04450 [Prevotella sp.]|nr:hypothetical protein [Prevotella sp.]